MISTKPTALVFMACGATKLPHAEQPIRLYQGPMWQTLRLKLGALPAGNVFVLSAGYGFINAQTFIQTYEQRLTPATADRMIERGIHARNDLTPRGIVAPHQAGPSAAASLITPGRLGEPRARSLIIAAGAEYRRVLDVYVAQFLAAGLLDPNCSIARTRGGIGEQRHQLGAWLDQANGRQALKAAA